jgi:hypothetical protein
MELLMTKQIKIIGVVILLLSYQFLLTAFAQESGSSQLFAVAKVHFEQNATDGDVEVVFEVKGGDEGLAKLKVVSPDGREVINFTAPDASTLGIRQFRFESPEPTDVEGLKAAYPQGIYKFTGSKADGVKYYSESSLNHKLPETVSFLTPAEEEESVNIENLQITWTPVKNLIAYTIEIDEEELGVNLQVKLPGTVSKFAVPEDFLVSNTEYTLSIGTVTESGNISVVETTFTTAGRE